MFAELWTSFQTKQQLAQCLVSLLLSNHISNSYEPHQVQLKPHLSMKPPSVSSVHVCPVHFSALDTHSPQHFIEFSCIDFLLFRDICLVPSHTLQTKAVSAPLWFAHNM